MRTAVALRELPRIRDAILDGTLTVEHGQVLARLVGKAPAQRRADALRDVFGLALRHGDLPDAGGSRPRISYVIPLGWQPDLTGDRYAPVDADRPAAAGCPAAAWTGPATRTRITTLLCDAQVERVVLDPHGRIISLTAEPEQITAAQRRAVAARDRCCTAKGCSRPPAFCDVHHLIARADGGSNDTTNLVLCRRHHTLWHRGQLTLTDLRVPWLRLPQPRAPDAPP